MKETMTCLLKLELFLTPMPVSEIPPILPKRRVSAGIGEYASLSYTFTTQAKYIPNTGSVLLRSLMVGCGKSE